MKALCVSNAEIIVYLPCDIHRELQSALGSPDTISLTKIFLVDTVPNVISVMYLCNQNERKHLAFETLK